MPSPFPGMNPYLEDPHVWPDAHQGLIGSMRAILNTLLPPGYIAKTNERCQVLPTECSIYPDVLIRIPAAPADRMRGATAVLDAPDSPLIVEELPSETPKETFLEIIYVADARRVVTTVELLSPVNKEGDGQALYQQKQKEILASQTHLIEIDLLRAGKHTVAAPTQHNELKTPYDYLVCLHRGGDWWRYAVWPNCLRDRLPRIAIPLDKGVPDVTLDLQAVFNRNYDEGAYAYQIDYTQAPPAPPLSEEDAAWADALLREHNLRP